MRVFEDIIKGLKMGLCWIRQVGSLNPMTGVLKEQERTHTEIQGDESHVNTEAVAWTQAKNTWTTRS